MIPLNLSASQNTSLGDSTAKNSADIYFGSAFAVGSGASATAAQDRSGTSNLLNVVVYGVLGLIGLAIVSRFFRPSRK
jgi:hypothetical protein